MFSEKILVSDYNFSKLYQEIRARVGLRRNALSSENNIYGDTLHVDGSTEDVRPSASTSRASSLPQQSAPSAIVNDYLVGVHLDEALASGQDILVSWPFADGDIRDWTQAEAIWYIFRLHPSCCFHRSDDSV
jgi:actin-related protein 9